MHRPSLLASLIFIGAIAGAPSSSFAGVDVGVSLNFSAPPPVAIAPPPLPIYVVPQQPMGGYLWMPGYWFWNGAGYFWIPGTWVRPPAARVLWTPGYWGWGGGSYLWHNGYWGPHVGFYGGVNYGGGYGGSGFAGGGWNGGVFVVNHAALIAPGIAIGASFNGGPGGVVAAASPQEMEFAHEHHFEATALQTQHMQMASQNPAFAASFNHGKPSIAATMRPADFAHGAVAAREAGPANHEAEQHNIAIKQNPSLAKGAALPRQGNAQNGSHINNAGAHPAGQTHAAHPAPAPHTENAPHPSEHRPAAHAPHEENGEHPKEEQGDQEQHH